LREIVLIIKIIFQVQSKKDICLSPKDKLKSEEISLREFQVILMIIFKKENQLTIKEHYWLIIKSCPKENFKVKAAITIVISHLQ